MDELLARFRNVGVDDRSELITQFGVVLHIDPATAQFFLESSDWNVEIAINTYLSTSGGQGNALMQSTMVPPEAQFLTDLSQTHGMQFPPRTVLPMTWQLANTGSQPWPEDACLIFTEGAQMDGPGRISLRAAAGEVVDVAISINSPAENGSYAGCWRMHCSTGYFSEPIWMLVNVRDDAGAELTACLEAFGVSSDGMPPLMTMPTEAQQAHAAQARHQAQTQAQAHAQAQHQAQIQAAQAHAQQGGMLDPRWAAPARAQHAQHAAPPPLQQGSGGGGFQMAQPAFSFGAPAPAAAAAAPQPQPQPQPQQQQQAPPQTYAPMGGAFLAQPAFQFGQQPPLQQQQQPPSAPPPQQQQQPQPPQFHHG